jgi:hypothetical protein
MGRLKDIQTEAEEKAADPVFRLAVILIMEDVLVDLFENVSRKFSQFFVFRQELRNFVWKKTK